MDKTNPVTAVQKEAAVISNDMRKLYSEFEKGKTDRVTADTLANIAGKNIKALALIVADQCRQDTHLQLVHKINAIENQA